MVARNGTPLFTASPTGTAVLEQKRHLYKFDPVLKIVSYEVFNRDRNMWIDTIDFGADGTPDVRILETADGKKSQEVRVGDHWFEMVTRDGHSGAVLNGRFMSFAEVRKELGIPSTNPLVITK
jgi:hypothetical protein